MEYSVKGRFHPVPNGFILLAFEGAFIVSKPRCTATMATNTRLVRLVVEHVPPGYVFSVREISRGDGSLMRPIATEVADTLYDAIAKAEDFAMEYLSQGIELVTTRSGLRKQFRLARPGKTQLARDFLGFGWF